MKKAHLKRILIEVAVGLIRTIRIGFNVGELLDFIVGWTTLDICRDDLGELLKHI